MRLHRPLFFDKPLLKVPKLVSRIPPVRASSDLAVFCRPKQEPQARSPRKMYSCGFPQEGPDAGPGSAAPLFTAASLTQSRPTGSALRANLFPKVMDPFCRLLLPTLVFRLEAVHLGDLLRMWVRSGKKTTLPHSDFQGPTGAHRTTQEARAALNALL
ncbi:hypothetical protein HPB50_000516 [Hyalomma asiaticum]|uniref:Uncharacterized protein n=1 Tax=Hyalomma asiaticum TaxID=266040 RepID=A0ACB7T0P3_HYAAI|nr:hypothetical protein HPB50_000516 [Hyalomma asiaticum]